MYDNSSQTLRIAPVIVPPRIMTFAQSLLRLEDRDLAERTSTSPDQEGPGFVADMRLTCRWMVAAAVLQPSEPVKQSERRCAEFAWVPGLGWHQIRADTCEDSRFMPTLSPSRKCTACLR